MRGRSEKKSLAFIVLIMLFLSLVQTAMALDVQPQESGQSKQSVTLPVPAQKLSVAWPFFNNTLREWRLQSAKSSATSGVDRIVKALGVAKNNIQGSNLPQIERARLIAEIDANITWCGEKRAEITNARDIATVKAIGKEVTDRWNVEKINIKKEVGEIGCDQYSVVIAEARKASSIASDKIKAISAQGKDTSAMDKKLASYDAHVSSAERYIAKARAEFDKINGPIGVDLYYSAGLRQLKLANGELQDAYADLKSLYSMIYRNSVTVMP